MRVYRGVRVVDPVSGVDEVRDLWVQDGCIVAPADGPFDEVDLRGHWCCRPFIDLRGEAVDRCDAEVAYEGGFGRVVLPPEGRATPDRLVRVLRRIQDLPVEVICSAALHAEGGELASIGTLLGLGAGIVSAGRALVGSPRALLDALRYAAPYGRPVFLRCGLAALEEGGLVRDGHRAAWLGLPGIPPVSEALGVWTTALLAREAGATVHLTHFWSAEGVEALREAQRQGLPVTGSTTALHLGASSDFVEACSYGGAARIDPPIGDAADRRALADALCDGVLVAVVSDHRPVTPAQKNVPIGDAEPGAVTYESTLSLVLGALREPTLVVSALLTGPASVLGMSVEPIQPGSSASLVVIDPEHAWTVGTRSGGAQAESPLNGLPLSGRVVGRLTDL